MFKIVKVFLSVFLIACSNINIWEGFNPAVDLSVGCSNIRQPTLNDIGLEKSEYMRIIPNKNNVPGLFMNAISVRPALPNGAWYDNSTYTFKGSFRKLQGSSNETIDINLQLVKNYQEHFSELFLSLNPYSSLYGWVWTRLGDLKPIKLYYVGDNMNWHTFTIQVKYTPSSYKTIYVEIDGHRFVRNTEMGAGTQAWPNSFQMLLETSNMYTNCSTLNNFTGGSEWKDVFLTYTIP